MAYSQKEWGQEASAWSWPQEPLCRSSGVWPSTSHWSLPVWGRAVQWWCLWLQQAGMLGLAHHSLIKRTVPIRTWNRKARRCLINRKITGFRLPCIEISPDNFLIFSAVRKVMSLQWEKSGIHYPSRVALFKPQTALGNVSEGLLIAVFWDVPCSEPCSVFEKEN